MTLDIITDQLIELEYVNKEDGGRRVTGGNKFHV